MVFCNIRDSDGVKTGNTVTILILIDGFLQFITKKEKGGENIVTILILIDGFLQYKFEEAFIERVLSHNPYFNRWFSAMWLNWQIR